MEAEGRDAATKQGMPRMAGKHQGPTRDRKRAGQILPEGLQVEYDPAKTLILNFSLGENKLLFQATNFVVIGYGSCRKPVHMALK